ncbi:MAG: CPXCG motif-containing cysteine-rich protein [Myxococcota bacterium]
MEQGLEVRCPACGQPTAVYVDWEDGTDELETDCQVCCHPIHVQVKMNAGRVENTAVGNEW